MSIESLFCHKINGTVYAVEDRDAIIGFIVALCQMDVISESEAREINANFIELTFY